jgi:hypothetical protein
MWRLYERTVRRCVRRTHRRTVRRTSDHVTSSRKVNVSPTVRRTGPMDMSGGRFDVRRTGPTDSGRDIDFT